MYTYFTQCQRHDTCYILYLDAGTCLTVYIQLESPYCPYSSSRLAPKRIQSSDQERSTYKSLNKYSHSLLTSEHNIQTITIS